MRVQIVISGFLLDPGGDVGADFSICSAHFVSRTNKVLVHVFKLLCGAGGVDWKYFVRLVITALLVVCFVPLCTDFMVDGSFKTR